MFAHGADWSINPTAFKYGESQQQVKAKSLSLGINKTTKWIGSETLVRYATCKFNSIPCLSSQAQNCMVRCNKN